MCIRHRVYFYRRRKERSGSSERKGEKEKKRKSTDGERGFEETKWPVARGGGGAQETGVRKRELVGNREATRHYA